jgi:GTPase SAR1 family protein
MGCCNTTEAQKENKKWNKELADEKRQDQSVKKLLFLGSGGSGKSTLFKQLRTLHGSGYADKDRLQFRDHIYAQVVEQMRLCLECIDILKEEQSDEYKDVDLTPAGKQAADVLQSAATLQVTTQIAEAVETLWKEDAIRLIYDLRATMKIDDSCAYFWDEVKRIAASDYVPNDKDILLVRYRTTGVIEQKFEMKKNLFHVFDVGGQKSERKKWIHCFELVTAVIFVASLSCYDEVMFEDEEKNSMVDSVELFEQICNNEWFKDTAMILFLNKKDIFAEKIENVPITECPAFQTFNGNTKSYDETTEYIKEVFEHCNQNGSKQIFTHLTCAVDKNQVEKVFNDIQTVIINASLAQGGLIA